MAAKCIKCAIFVVVLYVVHKKNGSQPLMPVITPFGRSGACRPASQAESVSSESSVKPCLKEIKWPEFEEATID